MAAYAAIGALYLPQLLLLFEFLQSAFDEVEIVLGLRVGLVDGDCVLVPLDGLFPGGHFLFRFAD